MGKKEAHLSVITGFFFIIISAVPANAILDLNASIENPITDNVVYRGLMIHSTTMTTVWDGLTHSMLFDDDSFGFVIGYNNNNYTSTGVDYIHTDWKQVNKGFNFSTWIDNYNYDSGVMYIPGPVKFFVDDISKRDYTGIFSDGSLAVCQFSREGVWFSNIASPVIPAPAGIVLSGFGIGFLSWLRKRRVL